MHIKCPHCLKPVELVETGDETASITCPTCGSNFALLPETVPPVPADLGSIGQFQLLQRVGRGHFGEVWKAFDETLTRNVALKLPRLAPGEREADREYQEMFLREARSAARLRHPHIVPVHEIARTERGIIIVSDFIDGVNLAELILHRRPDFRRSAEILKTVALAVHHGHERGVIHRDLKPGNILLDNAGEPYVTDFGLAKREAAEITITIDGQILGTPAYMPPEQARGKGHYADARSDVYSLGVILYELLTGQRPFTGDQALLIYQILNEEPKRPRAIDRAISKDLETICLRALEKAPDRRYATALEFAEELDRYLRGEPIRSRPITRVERGWRWVRRRPLVSALSAATALSLLLFVGVAWGWYALPRVDEKIVAPPPVVTKILLKTGPPGAEVVFVPLSDFDGTLQPEKLINAGKSPVERELKPGRYLVVAALNENRFHEVYRDVPKPDQGESIQGYRIGRYRWNPGRVAALETITIPEVDVAADMAPFAGSERFLVGSDEFEKIKLAPRHYVSLQPFFLDRSELTVAQFGKIYKEKTEEVRISGKAAPSEQHPIVQLSWDAAANLAEVAGKRLPDEVEHEFAATNGGRTRYPWGDKAPHDEAGWWDWSKVGAWELDQSEDNPSVKGLFSNVGEWTSTPGIFYPGAPFPQDDRAKHQRVVRGRFYFTVYPNFPPEFEASLAARTRYFEPIDRAHDLIGVRLARSAKPRLKPEDFGAILDK